VHQKTPVFLLKYCHNKDLKKIKPQISAKKSKSTFAEASADKSENLMAEILMTKTNLP